MKHVHDLKHLFEDRGGIVEVCKTCKAKVKTRKGTDSRINNRQYLKEHVKDLAQPHGRTGKVFKKFHGIPENFERKKQGVIKSIKDQADDEKDHLLAEIDRQEVGSNKLVY